MQVQQATFHSGALKAADFSALATCEPQCVLVFGAPEILFQSAPALAEAFSGAQRLGCSTAGEISSQGVSDGTLVVTALHFDHVQVRQASTELDGMVDSRAAGQRLAQQLPPQGLRAVLVLGQGVQINGSAVLAGLVESLEPGVQVGGGLAGDGVAFGQTWVLDNQGVSDKRIACVGLYGEALQVSRGSFGGWSPFGPARKVTRCDNNLLLELDGEPALTVYKRYLGQHAKALPSSGLLFPFAMLGQDHNEVGLIRTILGVDEQRGSMTLAGEIDPNGYLRLMHASADALVDGAATAARAAQEQTPGSDAAGLALLVSCVGRKLVMGGRVNEELEAVARVLGPKVTLAGLYAYAEMGPHGPSAPCELHNQTMTITCLSEAQ
ncbi:FIST signal transduction protein [Rhodoferax sp.]|jgi:hypothetical protein|uniref:FIST signal transduction protein n=1 Tax=Rhodoferax sp. TaxID=50421 RepID=UPI00378472CB